MKKVRAFFTLILLSAFVSAAEVKVGVFLHFPHVYTDGASKNLKGADIGYFKAMLKEMGHTVVFEVLPISRLMSALQAGEVDMAGLLLKTPEREAVAYFPDAPTVILQPALFLLADNKLSKISTIDDLKGMTIGYIPNSPIPKFLNVPEKIKFDLLGVDNWVEANLKKLLSGRVNALLDQNPFSYLAEAKKTGEQNKIKVLPLPIEGSKAYLLFSKKSQYSRELLNSFNKAAASKKISFDKFMDDEVK